VYAAVGKKILFELAYLVPEKAAGLVNQADKLYWPSLPQKP
jgi:hypothetical protein